MTFAKGNNIARGVLVQICRVHEKQGMWGIGHVH
jgi:hypothetical protein